MMGCILGEVGGGVGNDWTGLKSRMMVLHSMD